MRFSRGNQSPKSKKAKFVAVAALCLVMIAPASPAVAAPPANDLFAGRIPINLGFVGTANTAEATTDANDVEATSICGPPATDASVWFSFTAPANLIVEVNVSASNYSAGIIVVTGAPGSFVQNACGPQMVEFPAVAGTTYSILAFDDQGDEVGNGGTLQIAVAAAGDPDIKVTKSCPSSGGGSFTCTVQASNQGLGIAEEIVVTDDLPPGLTAGPVSSSNPAFKCTDPPGAIEIRCSVPYLPAGRTDTFTFTVRLGENGAPGQSFTNTATISSRSIDQDLGNNQATATLKIPACQKTGSALSGTAGPDVLCGTAGNDTISGLGGNDLIFLFAGKDSSVGGDGNDIIFGGAGADNLSGGNGNDTLNGGDGNDNLQGGPGTDAGNGGPGTDTCTSTESGAC